MIALISETYTGEFSGIWPPSHDIPTSGWFGTSSPPVSPPHVIHKIQCERRTRWYASIRSCAP